ncbi:MAG: biotin--[acetyl-CoA-carboxylase] ligase [Chitinispirillales bacterium]|jgi:BirA family biotin operon repressor/biotin-[acetyl-CoA-carboxylase] ligase|nr:biotin--[acetyl-CoA-carboxylase] ligase [Chitinispirillales bacterium]
MKYILLNDIDSTNNYAKTVSGVPDDEITVIRAIRQRCGRGRNDTPFFSDHAGGLWVSLIVPIADISAHFEHNRAISLAIRTVLLECMPSGNTPVSIKWPNDIYCGERKIAGILLENAPKKPNTLIIGFGINVNIAQDDFPGNLRKTTTSVLMEIGEEYVLDALLDRILCEYDFIIKHGPNGAHAVYAGNLYRKGYPATVGQHRGTFVTVEIDGRLRLDTTQGTMLLSSGSLRFPGSVYGE